MFPHMLQSDKYNKQRNAEGANSANILNLLSQDISRYTNFPLVLRWLDLISTGFTFFWTLHHNHAAQNEQYNTFRCSNWLLVNS